MLYLTDKLIFLIDKYIKNTVINNEKYKYFINKLLNNYIFLNEFFN